MSNKYKLPGNKTSSNARGKFTKYNSNGASYAQKVNSMKTTIPKLLKQLDNLKRSATVNQSSVVAGRKERVWFAIEKVDYPAEFETNYYQERKNQIKNDMLDDDELEMAMRSGDDDNDIADRENVTDSNIEAEVEVSEPGFRRHLRTGGAYLTCTVTVYSIRTQSPIIVEKSILVKGKGIYMIEPYLLFHANVTVANDVSHLKIDNIINVRCMPFNIANAKNTKKISHPRIAHLQHMFKHEAMIEGMMLTSIINSITNHVLKMQTDINAPRRRKLRNVAGHGRNGQVEDEDFDAVLSPDVLKRVRTYSLYYMQKRLRDTVGLYREHIKFDMAKFFAKSRVSRIDELRHLLHTCPWELVDPAMRKKMFVKGLTLQSLREIHNVYEAYYYCGDPDVDSVYWDDKYALAFLVGQLVMSQTSSEEKSLVSRSASHDMYTTVNELVQNLAKVVQNVAKDHARKSHEHRMSRQQQSTSLNGIGNVMVNDNDEHDDGDQWDPSSDLYDPQHYTPEPGNDESSDDPNITRFHLPDDYYAKSGCSQDRFPNRSQDDICRVNHMLMLMDRKTPRDPLGMVVNKLAQCNSVDELKHKHEATYKVFIDAIQYMVDRKSIVIAKFPGHDDVDNLAAPVENVEDNVDSNGEYTIHPDLVHTDATEIDGNTRLYCKSVWDDMIFIMSCQARAQRARDRLMDIEMDWHTETPLSTPHWRDTILERGYRLNHGQLNAVRQAVEGDSAVVSVTGLPGTGKTLFIEALLHACDTLDCGRVVLTQCGKMADEHRIRFGIEGLMGRDKGDTVSSHTRHGRDNQDYAGGVNDVTSPFADPHIVAHTIHMAHTLRQVPKACDFHTGEVFARCRMLVIDEAQNNDIRLMAMAYRVAFDPDQHSDEVPVLIVHVGDHNQIQPIGRGKPFLDTMESIPRSVCELTENKRCAPGEDDALVSNVEKMVAYDTSVKLSDTLRWKNNEDAARRTDRVEFITCKDSDESYEKIINIYRTHKHRFHEIQVVTSTVKHIKWINDAIGDKVQKLVLQHDNVMKTSPIKTLPYCAAAAVGRKVWFRKNYRSVQFSISKSHSEYQIKLRQAKKSGGALRVQPPQGGFVRDRDFIISDRVSNGTIDWISRIQEYNVYLGSATRATPIKICTLRNSGKRVCIGDHHVDAGDVSPGFVSTVHAMTGSENDIVVVCLDPKTDLSWVYKPNMVVACSRAKQKLYVLATRHLQSTQDYNLLIERRGNNTGTHLQKVDPTVTKWVCLDVMPLMEILCSSEGPGRRSDMARYAQIQHAMVPVGAELEDVSTEDISQDVVIEEVVDSEDPSPIDNVNDGGDDETKNVEPPAKRMKHI